jgi:hypothetical protein
MMTEFEKRKRMFEHVCSCTGIPVSLIRESLPDDPCDFTSDTEVRLNIPAAKDVEASYHVAHVFGHYLCCVHEAGDNEGDERCDMIADAIARIVLNKEMLDGLQKMWK